MTEFRHPSFVEVLFPSQRYVVRQVCSMHHVTSFSNMRSSFDDLSSYSGGLDLDLDPGLQHQLWVGSFLRPWRYLTKRSHPGEHPFLLFPSLGDTFLPGVTTSHTPTSLHFLRLLALFPSRYVQCLFPLCHDQFTPSSLQVRLTSSLRLLTLG